MPATYNAIATTTLSSAQNTVSFTSISGNYTDLLLVSTPITASGGYTLRIRFNGDTASNYSNTSLRGDGSSATSARESNITSGYAGYTDLTNAAQNNVFTHILNYANATTNKTFIGRSNNAGASASANVGLWRKSPEAITSIELALGSSFPNVQFAIGSTFTLYGIKAA